MMFERNAESKRRKEKPIEQWLTDVRSMFSKLNRIIGNFGENKFLWVQKKFCIVERFFYKISSNDLYCIRSTFAVFMCCSVLESR